MGDIERLQEIKETIEKMTLCHQKQILTILNEESSVILSENNNGIFINLSDLDQKVLIKMEEYIEYVDTQQSQLLSMENKKDNIKNSFFVGNNKSVQKKKDKEECINICNGE